LAKRFGFAGEFTQVVIWLFNGSVAVSIFFVLSGLVLGLSLDRLSWSWKGVVLFWKRRFFRIYPAYVLLMLATFLYLVWLGQPRVYSVGSEWLGWWFRFQPGVERLLKELVKNLLFVSTSLSGVTWTLQVEALMGLVFPLFYYISRRFSMRWQFFVLLGVIGVSVRMLPVFRPAGFMYMFYLGLLLPRYLDVFTLVRSKLGDSWMKLVLWFLVAVALSARFSWREEISLLVEAFVAMFFIAYLVLMESDSAGWLLGRCLVSKWWQWLGRISYSFYLFHFLVLFVVAQFVLERVSLVWLSSFPVLVHALFALMSVSLSLYVSYWSFVWVERWGMKR
jgi:peptidoglycan/LPS O-acetylase OafA/YrhL